MPFRATKDIDMILIMEDNFPEFASVFWEYIKEGGYKCGWKNEQNMHFYRFTEGKFGYPTMIELFSRKPGYHLEIEEGISAVDESEIRLLQMGMPFDRDRGMELLKEIYL